MIALFPTMYLQAKGRLTYKKFSFEIAKKDFSKEEWKAIEKTTLIRSNWKPQATFPLIDPYLKINPILYCQLNSGLMDMFEDVKKTNNIDIKSLVKEMHALSESAWSRIKKNVKRL